MHPGFQCNSMRYQSGKRHSNRGVGDITHPQRLSTMAQAGTRRRPIGVPMLRRDERSFGSGFADNARQESSRAAECRAGDFAARFPRP